ncbi:MAG: hypothetical protein B6I31_02980, partial [Desulfobacteraceae bacterium 4572_19]
NIILFPLVYEDNIKGVIELGSSNEFTPTIIEFLELASYTIATVINAALTSENLNELFVREELLASNEEMEEKNKLFDKWREEINKKA